ncbi:MAG: hypothetical protein MZU97_08195 [Bacillus subtilis]|nr:hypothetical protein [Bacillus subtilis]
MLHGRRYSDGLHEAIEAKERIKIARRNRTLATITFQNYFRMYDKIAGMTGTADTEAPEFAQDLQPRRRRHPHQHARGPQRRGRPRLPQRGGEVRRHLRRDRRGPRTRPARARGHGLHRQVREPVAPL